ncbi:DUF5784 family protein [Halobacteriales archaeon Cl-PHB]
MAGPIRLRESHESWSVGRVERDLLRPLQDRFGATLETAWFKPPGGYEARRLEMDNGDLALFCWSDANAYWLGNTETPEALWRTEKVTFDEAPYEVARWAQRELLASLHDEEPWLADYDHLSWFFLPVFLSKDGRETTRAFFREHSAGFPDADRDDALQFYEAFLGTGVLDDYRYTMAAKLGTSERNDLVRMGATMAEFNAAKLLQDAGHDFQPEVELDSGHALDYRVADTLVEVTRPSPPSERRAGTPASALRETVDGKTRDQLKAHEGAVLLVDCSSFRDDEWQSLLAEKPDPGYKPAAVYRLRPSGRVEGYTTGRMPLDLDSLFAN